MSTLILFLLVIVGGLAVIVSWRPDEFSVSRTGFVAAPPEKVFPHINDLHKWQAWSPWAKLDPNAVNRFEGPDAGVGAAMSWSGNKNVGVGRMTILESAPGESVRMKLDFEKPMKSTSIVDFALAPEGAGTRVTWTMAGRNNFIGKAMSLLMNCDKMVGGQFEQGLANLNAVAGESAA